MKLTHPLFSEPICFRENRVPVLVVENPAAFRRLAAELMQQSEGENGAFVLSQDDNCLDCAAHLNAVLDFLHVPELEKRLQTKLMSLLLKNTQEALAQESFQLSQLLQSYLGKLAALAEYPVHYEQADNLPALLKAMDFRVDFEGISACEALYEYMGVLHGMARHQCFVLIHAHDYFSRAEIQDLYKMAQYRKMALLMLESQLREPLDCEEIRLYDGDLCELRLESGENTQ